MLSDKKSNRRTRFFIAAPRLVVAISQCRRRSYRDASNEIGMIPFPRASATSIVCQPGSPASNLSSFSSKSSSPSESTPCRERRRTNCRATRSRREDSRRDAGTGQNRDRSGAVSYTRDSERNVTLLSAFRCRIAIRLSSSGRRQPRRRTVHSARFPFAVLSLSRCNDRAGEKL